MSAPFQRLRRFWADRPLRTKGLVVIALPMLILFGALFWVGVATREEEAAEDSVQQTLQIQADLQSLEAVIDRAALSAELSPESTIARARIAEAKETVPKILDDLANAIRDGEQRRRLQRVGPIAREIVLVIGDRSAFADRGLGALDQFGRELQAMRAREASLLAARSLLADAARSQNVAITRIAAMVGLIGGLAAALLFFAGVVRRVAFLEANAHRLARGEPLRHAPAGADEIGRLGDALDEASALLSERQHRLEELVARLFQIQEDERRRVAYELHDGLAQVAASAHQHLQAYAERFPPEAPEARIALDRGLRLVQRAVGETRGAIAGLRPTALDDFGLSLALKLEVDALRPQVGEATFEDAMDGRRLSAVAETALFRIAQEGLTNVRKHAGSSVKVHVRLEHCDGLIRLSVSDDGPGFDATSSATATRDAGERIGLDAMRERIAIIGGRIDIATAVGAGTRVEVEIAETQR